MLKYSKVKKIGEGAYGKAFLVRHRDNHLQYVIKEMEMLRVRNDFTASETGLFMLVQARVL